ncbi:hypothetical protein U1701_09515 [Sphingomonas sp. PB2P19]|uniref:hypothetical protein n=1 Tax=Sphingomonas rhamnosi TaxID=3096156 RepID=UPI002FC89470
MSAPVVKDTLESSCLIHFRADHCCYREEFPVTDIERSTLYKCTPDGQIKTIKVGIIALILVRALTSFIDRCPVKTAERPSVRFGTAEWRKRTLVYPKRDGTDLSQSYSLSQSFAFSKRSSGSVRAI